MKNSSLAISIVCILSASAVTQAGERPLPAECSYEMQVWNVHMKSSAGVTNIRHAYSELSPEEIDPATGCTVCSEDQAIVDIPPAFAESMYNRAVRARTLPGTMTVEDKKKEEKQEPKGK